MATSLAVIAFPLASAARTALLVAPDAVRTLPLPFALWELARPAEFIDADNAFDRPSFGAAGARLPELDVGELLLLALPGPSAVNSRRSLSTPASRSSRRC